MFYHATAPHLDSTLSDIEAMTRRSLLEQSGPVVIPLRSTFGCCSHSIGNWFEQIELKSGRMFASRMLLRSGCEQGETQDAAKVAQPVDAQAEVDAVG